MRWLALLCAATIACGGDGKAGDTGKQDAADPTGDGNPMQDGNNNPDASFGPGAICGANVCIAPQECCTGAMINCKLAADCPTQHFACDGPEDCPGAVCCFGNGGQMGSECKGSCGDVACHFDSDCSGGTPKCCPKMFTPSYKACQASC